MVESRQPIGSTSIPHCHIILTSLVKKASENDKLDDYKASNSIYNEILRFAYDI